MSNVTAISTPLPTVYDYLGPGTVTSVHPTRVGITLPDGRCFEARPALAFSYQLGLDDQVLVIGDDAGHYVIGVLECAGAAVLSHHGDIELRAVGGKVRLTGDEGCEMQGPEVSLQTRRLSIVADRLQQAVGSLICRARELWSLEAGEQQTRVAGKSYQRAKSATILTEDKVAINGKAVHLG